MVKLMTLYQLQRPASRLVVAAAEGILPLQPGPLLHVAGEDMEGEAYACVRCRLSGREACRPRPQPLATCMQQWGEVEQGLPEGLWIDIQKLS